VIAVVGNLSYDRVEGTAPRAGGGPLYGARALRELGAPGLVVARCAPADRPTLLPPLTAVGLPVTWRPAATTPAFSFAYDGETRRMTVDAVADPWPPQRLPAEVGWAHVAALARTDFPAACLAGLAEGRRLSLDGQGLVRPGRTGPLVLDADYDPELLRCVTVLKLAETEAAVLAGGADPDGLRALGVPEVVVTLGSRGCLVVAGGESVHVPAPPVSGVTDPTGAGDSFAAAYVCARDAGAEPAAAARAAAETVAALLSGRRSR